MFYALEAYSMFTNAQATPAAEHFFCSMVTAYGRPFTENYGVGSIKCEYPSYPDFSEPEMNQRHQRLMDLRNKFLAHSSAEGTRVMIVPPNVENPVTGRKESGFDHNVGKRVFIDQRFADWLVEVVHAFKERLDKDVAAKLASEFGATGQVEPFEIETNWNDFSWS